MAFVNIREEKRYNPRNDTFIHPYQKLFRFERQNVKYLAENLLHETHETRGGALSSVKRMECFLRYAGDPGFQYGVGEDLGITQSTVSKTFHGVMDEMAAHLDRWIHFPSTPGELNAAKQNFRFPNAIGVIDGTHVYIDAPRHHPEEYLNRKKRHSFNVQVTCDGGDRFTSVVAEWPGSVHDSRILRVSPVPGIMRGSGALLLGDAGYPIKPWLMTPYKSATTQPQTRFNTMLSHERVSIERVIGQLKRRFPILKDRVRIKTDRVPILIACCAMLHNISKFLDDPVPDEDEATEEDNREDGVEEGDDDALGPQDAVERAQGQQIRENLTQTLHW